MGGLTLDAEACRLLHDLALYGATALRHRSGGGRVPASTADLLHALGKAAGQTPAPAMPGTGWGSAPVPAGASGHADTYTAAEAASRWGCTDSYVRRLCRNGVVPADRDGDGWVIAGDYVRGLNRPPTDGRSDGRGDA